MYPFIDNPRIICIAVFSYASVIFYHLNFINLIPYLISKTILAMMDTSYSMIAQNSECSNVRVESTLFTFKHKI